MKKLAYYMSAPMVVSMISIALYGIVDMAFIAKISSEALTAAALSIPVQSIITAVSLGTSIGLNALLAKTLGEENRKKSKNIIQIGFLLMITSWVGIFIASQLGIKDFFGIFTDNESIRRLGYNYLSIISGFSLGSLYQILFEKILEAYGRTKASMIVQFSGAVINLVLDPILIFGYFGLPELGIKGAAISTIVGQFAGMAIGFIILLRSRIITIKELLKTNIEGATTILKDIYKVGFPTIILESADSLITLILNSILSGYSAEAISVWGIYGQLQKFVIIIVYGFNYGMIPILAYNWGAKHKERIGECIRLFLKIALVVTFIGQVVFTIWTRQLVEIYSESSELLETAIPAFRILASSFMAAGVSLTLSATFQAFGNGLYSLIVNLSRKIVFVLPLIIVMENIVGINGIWISFVVAEFITMLLSIELYRKNKKKVLANMELETCR